MARVVHGAKATLSAQDERYARGPSLGPGRKGITSDLIPTIQTGLPLSFRAWHFGAIEQRRDENRSQQPKKCGTSKTRRGRDHRHDVKCGFCAVEDQHSSSKYLCSPAQKKNRVHLLFSHVLCRWSFSEQHRFRATSSLVASLEVKGT